MHLTGTDVFFINSGEYWSFAMASGKLNEVVRLISLIPVI